jgi:hypothetical protein
VTCRCVDRFTINAAWGAEDKAIVGAVRIGYTIDAPALGAVNARYNKKAHRHDLCRPRPEVAPEAV